MRFIGFILLLFLYLLAQLSFYLVLSLGFNLQQFLYMFAISLFFSILTYGGMDFVFRRHIMWMQENIKNAMNYIRDPHMRCLDEKIDSEFFKNLMEFFRKKQEEIKRDIAKRDEFIRWLTEEVNRCSYELNKKNKELIEKEKSIALGHLVATIAHKLGTPLNSISGHIQLILANNRIEYDIKNRLNIINQELQRIEKIIRQALDVLILERQKSEKIFIKEFLSDVVDFLMPSLKKEVENIEVNIDPNLSVIYSDPDMIREVLINLISNANESIEEKGFIKIIVGRIDEEMCYIKVVDNGIGISNELKERIFEPFFTTKHKGKASGLGLTICREIARALGGDIEVESTVGKGSVFTFKFRDKKEGRV